MNAILRLPLFSFVVCLVASPVPSRATARVDGAAGVAESVKDPRLESPEYKEIRALADSGWKKFKDGDFKGATSDFTRRIELDPHNSFAYDARGLAEFSDGDTAGAEADFNRAVVLAPKLVASYLNLIRVKRSNGDDAGAVAECLLALRADPKSVDAYLALGDLKLSCKDNAGAEKAYTRAIQLMPGNIKTWAHRAAMRYRQGRDKEAVADWKRAILCKRLHSTYDADRAYAKYCLGDLAGAIADYRHSIAIHAQEAWSFYFIAFIEAQQHQYADALQDALHSLEQDTRRDADYRNFLVWTLLAKSGQSGNADQRLAAYLTGRPGDSKRKWPGDIGAFLLGRESEESFFAHAHSGDSKEVDGQLCEAWYYSGLKKLFAGDKSAAAQCFRRSLATKQRGFFEYELAQAELRSL